MLEKNDSEAAKPIFGEALRAAKVVRIFNAGKLFSRNASKAIQFVCKGSESEIRQEGCKLQAALQAASDSRWLLPVLPDPACSLLLLLLGRMSPSASCSNEFACFVCAAGWALFFSFFSLFLFKFVVNLKFCLNGLEILRWRCRPAFICDFLRFYKNLGKSVGKGKMIRDFFQRGQSYVPSRR